MKIPICYADEPCRQQTPLIIWCHVFCFTLNFILNFFCLNVCEVDDWKGKWCNKINHLYYTLKLLKTTTLSNYWCLISFNVFLVGVLDDFIEFLYCKIQFQWWEKADGRSDTDAVLNVCSFPLCGISLRCKHAKI